MARRLSDQDRMQHYRMPVRFFGFAVRVRTELKFGFYGAYVASAGSLRSCVIMWPVRTHKSNTQTPLPVLMRPGTKKWIYQTAEIALFLTFAGCGILAADAVRQVYNAGLANISGAPVIVWVWVGVGLALGFCRIQAGRYSRAEALNVLSAPSFVEAYRRILTDSINSLVTILRSQTNQKELLDTAEDAILTAITETVDYFRNATARKQTPVSCVLMEPKLYDAATDVGLNILGLEPGSRDHLEFLLHIVKMARGQLAIPIDFWLPVYNTNGAYRDKIPLGAPRAFATGEKQIINFTLWLWPHRGNSSKPVRKELWRYFWRHRKDFLSFASIAIVTKGKAVAVVNIHCKWVRVLGKNPTMIVDFLVPLLTVLSYIYELKGGIGKEL